MKAENNNNRIQNLKDKLNEADDEIIILENKLKFEKEHSSDLNKKLNESNNKLHVLKIDLQKAEENLVLFKNDLIMKDIQIKSLEMKIKSFEEDKLKKEKEEDEQENNKEEEPKKKVIVIENNNKIDELTNQLKTEKENNEKLQKDCFIYINKINSFIEQIKELEKELIESENKFSYLSEINNNSNHKKLSLGDEIFEKNVTEEIKNLLIKNKKLNDEIIVLNNEINILRMKEQKYLCCTIS
jgi:chromosome segregation ATPase